MVDVRDRGTIVCENRQLRREKESLAKEKKLAERREMLAERREEELVEKNESLAKEKKLTERREKGERLLRVGYAINQGGQERVSVV